MAEGILEDMEERLDFLEDSLDGMRMLLVTMARAATGPIKLPASVVGGDTEGIWEVVDVAAGQGQPLVILQKVEQDKETTSSHTVTIPYDKYLREVLPYNKPKKE